MKPLKAIHRKGFDLFETPSCHLFAFRSQPRLLRVPLEISGGVIAPGNLIQGIHAQGISSHAKCFILPAGISLRYEGLVFQDESILVCLTRCRNGQMSDDKTPDYIACYFGFFLLEGGNLFYTDQDNGGHLVKTDVMDRLPPSNVRRAGFGKRPGEFQ